MWAIARDIFSVDCQRAWFRFSRVLVVLKLDLFSGISKKTMEFPPVIQDRYTMILGEPRVCGYTLFRMFSTRPYPILLD